MDGIDKPTEGMNLTSLYPSGRENIGPALPISGRSIIYGILVSQSVCSLSLVERA